MITHMISVKTKQKIFEFLNSINPFEDEIDALPSEHACLNVQAK